MKRKERQQKFHDSLVNMLYTSPSPPPPPPPPHKDECDEQTLNFAREIVNSDSHHINTDELKEERSLSASSEEEAELGLQKFTRAQRKRLRRKKLKEAAASQHRQIIGPQLPPAPTGDDRIDGEVSDVHEHQHPAGVRRNAAAERPSQRK